MKAAVDIDAFTGTKREMMGHQCHDRLGHAATIVIRAHRFCQAGRVQELIEECQEVGFENFALRAQENIETPRYLTPAN